MPEHMWMGSCLGAGVIKDQPVSYTHGEQPQPAKRLGHTKCFSGHKWLIFSWPFSTFGQISISRVFFFGFAFTLSVPGRQRGSSEDSDVPLTLWALHLVHRLAIHCW